eukprot:TRINITY_DN15803_c0_g1_i1.p1 TRINITY_DN15803_c0_g1~~TRINITY_DN15803_c0_g1_i1.p1  ORF type:complete len:299 (+),score=71.27 TRINITY_DN15803_c0_g1_i1:150-1046(+)
MSCAVTPLLPTDDGGPMYTPLALTGDETRTEGRRSSTSSRPQPLRQPSSTMMSNTLESPNFSSRHAGEPAHRKKSSRFRSGLVSLRPVDKCTEDTGLKGPAGATDCGTPPWATEVMPWLFLGSASDAGQHEEMLKRGVRYVLDLAPEAKVDHDTDAFEYLCVQIHDHSDVPVRSEFERAFQWLDKVRESGQPALIHCRQGISRSATFTIGYLMRTLGIPYRLAHDVVKRRRPAINPNLGFVTSLEEYEAELGIDLERPLGEYAERLAGWGLYSRLCSSDPGSDSDIQTPKTAPPGFEH